MSELGSNSAVGRCGLNVRITSESGHPADIGAVAKVQVIAAIRRSGVTEYPDRSAGLVRRYVSRSNHLSPFLGFLSEVFSEIRRRTGKYHGTKLREPRLELSIGEARIDLGVELIDDLGGRALGGADAIPRTRIVTGDEIGHNRNVGQRLRAHRGGHRQRPQPARSDVLDRRRERTEHQLYLATQQVGQRRRRAAIRDVHQFDTGHQLEQLASHVKRTSYPGRPIIDLTWIGLRIRSERFIEIAACRVRAHRAGWVSSGAARQKLQGRIGLARPEKKCPDGLVTIPVQA
jgi:hypothetical protein